MYACSSYLLICHHCQLINFYITETFTISPIIEVGGESPTKLTTLRIEGQTNTIIDIAVELLQSPSSCLNFDTKADFNTQLS